jgi:hypothetical protein
VAVGGGTKGGLWTQIVSDVTGRPQDLPEQTIGATYGDALLAARSIGLAGSDEDWSGIAGTVEPDPENRKLYNELDGVYRELYPATRELAHKLAKMQKGGGESSPEAVGNIKFSGQRQCAMVRSADFTDPSSRVPPLFYAPRKGRSEPDLEVPDMRTLVSVTGL